jgi:phosphoglycerol transferase MdoB-like AlkP superfamily enzyme
MPKNPNIYKFEIIERIISEVDFTTKEEVVEFAERVRDIALDRPDMKKEIKDAFKNAYKEIDEELTPNINKLAKEAIYFSNFYSHESVGNSSYRVFTLPSSLLPSSSGTVFIIYFIRDYETILKLLKEEKDYYTFSMHGNKGDAWNRNVTYSYLGYDDFYYYTKDYEIDETIGLGLSDKSFFRQSVEIIKDIDSKNENWYGTLVMLTNHTPFSDIEKFDYFTITNGTHILILSDEQINTMSGEELSSLRIKTVDLSIFQ